MTFSMRRGGAVGAAAAMAFLAILQASPPAVAMGSSGGETPSMSLPTYDPSVDYAAGVAALNAGQYKQAEKSLSRVANAAPDSPELWLMLGRANTGQNDFKGAQKAYERALKLEPDNLEAHKGRGLALAALKDAKAQGELDWLTARSAACGESCADAPDIKAAIEALKAAMGGAPQASLEAGALMFTAPAAGDRAYLAAVALINEHRYDEALQALDRARVAFGPHPDVLTYQGYAWRKKGDWSRAETYYRQALAVAPAHKGALEYFGELKVVRGDIEGARNLLARLDRACTFGCPEAEELRRWISAGRAPGA